MAATMACGHAWGGWASPGARPSSRAMPTPGTGAQHGVGFRDAAAEVVAELPHLVEEPGHGCQATII